MERCRPGTIRALFNFLASDEYKMSFTKVDFPDPLTPVTATKAASGNSTSIFFKLFSFACFTTSFRSEIALRFFGVAISLRPAK